MRLGKMEDGLGRSRGKGRQHQLRSVLGASALAGASTGSVVVGASTPAADWFTDAMGTFEASFGWDDLLDDTRALDQVLRAKGIPAIVDYWGHDVNHDWPWWQKMLPYHLGRLLGD